MNSVIDLTYPINEGMTSFGAYWHPLVEISQIGRIEFEGRETRKISFGTHTGTHMDAPLHFIPNAKSIDQIPLQLLIGEVQILDFTNLVENTILMPDMIKECKLGERVILNFGWGKYWGTKKFYSDYPYLGKEFAEYLIDRGVKLLGMDTPSPDDSKIKLEKDLLGTDYDSPIHKLLLNNNIILLEYLANLDLVKDVNYWNIAAMPLKILGADGAPIRACLFK